MRALQYAAAVGLLGIAALVRFSLPEQGLGPRYLLFLVAVVLSAWIGGTGPAALALGLGAVLGLVVFGPLDGASAFDSGILLGLVLYLIAGFGVLGLTRHLNRARRHAYAHQADLERQRDALSAEIEERRRSDLECQRLNGDLRKSDERYRAFIENSSEAIWLFETDGEIPRDAPEDAQIEAMYRHGYLAETNAVMARLYGFPSPEAMVGLRLDDLMPKTDPANIEYLRQFIRSRYRLTDAESVEVDAQKKKIYLLNNLIGIVEDGVLRRAWGTSRDITQMKTMAEELRLSEERFRMAAKAVKAVIYEWDLITGETVRATGLCDMLGFEPQDAESSALWWETRVHPEDRGLLQRIRQSFATGANGYSEEYRLQHRDGRWLHVWDRGVVVRDALGTPIRVYGSTIDVTAQVESRRRIEDLAAAAELHFRQLEGVFQSMTEGVSVFAPGGNLISMNASMMRMHGFEPGEDYEFAAEELAACFESVDASGRKPNLEELPAMRALNGHLVQDYELAVCRLGGKQFRTISYNATPVRNAEGVVVLAVVTARDITDEKRAEEALRQSELHYRTLADAVPNIVFTTLADGTFDYCNRIWFEYTGLDNEVDLSTAWQEIVHPEDLSAFRVSWSGAGRGDGFEVECRLRGADGSYRWFLSRAHPLKNDSGDVVKWFGTCTDIEDQKRAVSDIRHANLQLAAARDQAVEANRAKSSFLANISHELRTPLTAILGYAEMIEEDAREEGRFEEIQDLENITAAARQLLGLINGLLDLAKVEAGRMDLDLAEFDIETLVREAADTAVPLARVNSNQLNVVCEPGLGTMYADQDKVRQVLINLLSNGCKFTENGEVEIAAFRETIDGENWITFTVTDSGIGIDPEQIDQLFLEFVQADTTTTRKHGGTGLGLAITKRFVQLMRGHVSAESELGKGATFLVRLPERVA